MVHNTMPIHSLSFSVKIKATFVEFIACEKWETLSILGALYFFASCAKIRQHWIVQFDLSHDKERMQTNSSSENRNSCNKIFRINVT